MTAPLERAAELLRIVLTDTCEKVDLNLSREGNDLKLSVTVALRRDHVERTTVHTITAEAAASEAGRQAAIRTALADLRRAIEMVLELG